MNLYKSRVRLGAKRGERGFFLLCSLDQDFDHDFSWKFDGDEEFFYHSLRKDFLWHLGREKFDED